MVRNLNLVVLFTHGVSLSQWFERGLLDREIDFYTRLSSNGVNVTFLTYGDCSDRLDKSLIKKINVVPIFENKRRPKSQIYSLLYSLLVPWFYRDIFQQADLLKTNQIWGSWVGVIAKYLWQTPLLVRCGYEPSLSARYKGWRRCILPIYRLMYASVYRLGDFCHFGSLDDAEYVAQYYNISRGKIKVAPNWMEVPDVKSKQDQLTAPRSILAVGRLSKEKNISLLIRALEGTGLSLKIVGIGEEKTSLEMLAEAHRVEVVFLGYVSKPELYEIYASHSIYAICSLYEGSPKSLFEAMSCGCAVVATNSRGIRNVLNDGVNGLVVARNHLDVRRAILRLVSDEHLRIQLSKNAVEEISSNYSLDLLIESELNTYKKILNL